MLGAVRGLESGGVDVTALANAINSGSIAADWIQGQTFNAGYASTPQLIPAGFYVGDGTAQQIASLLGGSVVKRVPESLQGTGIPLANFISLPTGEVNAASIVQLVGTSVSIWGLDNTCGRSMQLTQIVPGGVMGTTCQAQLAASQPAQQIAQTQAQYQPPNDPNIDKTVVQVGSQSGSVNLPPPVVNSTNVNSSNLTPGVLQDDLTSLVSGSGAELISGVPNWALLVGLVVGVVVLKEL